MLQSHTHFKPRLPDALSKFNDDAVFVGHVTVQSFIELHQFSVHLRHFSQFVLGTVRRTDDGRAGGLRGGEVGGVKGGRVTRCGICQGEQVKRQMTNTQTHIKMYTNKCYAQKQY